MTLGSKMESDPEETLSPMLLEDSPPPDDTKKRAWPRRLQIPLGVLVVGLVGGGVLCFLSFADSKDVEMVKAGNIFLGDFQERDRRNLLSSGGPPSPCSTASIKILVRKEVGNPRDYFDKSYEEYKEGFAARGESWLGLDALHSLTSLKDYKLKIILTDFDRRQYVAFYDLFKVGPEEDGYRLTVGSFNEAESTLGDSMISRHNGMKFSTKDWDQDDSSVINCAAMFTGGWWYDNCANARLTGQHTDRRRQDDGYKQIYYYHGGERGDSDDSWKEATMELIPRD